MLKDSLKKIRGVASETVRLLGKGLGMILLYCVQPAEIIHLFWECFGQVPQAQYFRDPTLGTKKPGTETREPGGRLDR